MRNILFILSYRSGTNLWKFLNGKQLVGFTASKNMATQRKSGPLINNNVPENYAFKNDWHGSKNSFYLPTLPEKICPCDLWTFTDVPQVPFDYHAWHGHTGDWWGFAKSKDIPEPYELETPTRFGPNDLRKYGPDWTFIQLVRDGRNQIESLRKLPAGIEEQLNKEDPEDYFKVLCKGYRNRSRMAIDCNSQLDNFKLYYFEDFITDPVGQLKDMYTFAGLKLDEDFVKNAFDYTKAKRSIEQHSSFKTNKGMNNRWDSWTDKEKEIFYNIAGKELIEIGYK